MAPDEATEFVKPAAAVLARYGFTAGECFLEMMLQDIGQPFDCARACVWIEAERALPAVGGRKLLLGIAPQDIRRLERGTGLAKEWGT